MIDLYTAPTPNGWKASVALEEMKIPYTTHIVNIMADDQKKPEFLAISPNGRIPAIVDRDNDDFAIFESGAILIYLAELSGKLLPSEKKARSEVMQWLMWQMGGLGPMMGQLNVFYRYFPEKIPSAIERYNSEVNRLFGVLDLRLQDNEFIAGGEYSIADIANWCWARTYKWSGIDIEPYAHVQRWLKAIRARPAADKGIKVPFDVSAVMENDDASEQFAKGAQTIVQGVDKNGQS